MNDGSTSLHLAGERVHQAVLRLLREAGGV
jgi:hypothetical protein